MTSLMQSKRTKRQAARQNSAKMAISDARLAFTQERPLLCYKSKSPDQITQPLAYLFLVRSLYICRSIS